MSDLTVVEVSNGLYQTSVPCGICRRITTWRRKGDKPWYCTRCGRQELPEDVQSIVWEDISVGFCGRCGTIAQFDRNPCGHCRAPVWGLWIGEYDPPPGKVWIECPLCKYLGAIPTESRKYACFSCKKILCFAFCKRCERVSQLLSKGINDFWCAYCLAADGVLPATAGAYFIDSIVRGSWVPINDPDMRWVNDCVVLAAAGVSFPTGATCVLRFDANGLGMIQPVDKRVAFWQYSEIHALDLGGPGLVQTQTGGGFIGGGFGLQGAAEGMLSAAALNALTTRKRTSITTLIVLKTITSEVVFLNQHATPERLQLELTPAFLRLRMAHTAAVVQPESPGPSVPSDPVVRLRELAALVKEGILTDQEFQEAKKRILENIG